MAALNPTAEYQVRLTTSVQIGRIVFKPLNPYRMKGLLIAKIREAHGDAVVEIIQNGD